MKLIPLLALRSLFACFVLVGAFGFNTAAGAEGLIPGVKLSVARPQVPLLIRNDRGPLLQVTIEVGRADPAQAHLRSDVYVTALSFSLEGTDALWDLESLALLTTEEVDTFPVQPNGRVPETTLGGLLNPAPALTFRINRQLLPGKNIFWLTGRLAAHADLGHRVAARCTAAETNVGRLVPAPAALGPAQRIGVALRRHLDDGVDTYRIPTLAVTAKGSLLVAYDVRRLAPGQDLQGDIDVGISRSTDGGRTWEPVRIAMDMGEYGGLPQAENGVSDPGLVVDLKTGTIFCFGTWMNGKAGYHQWVGNGSEAGFEIGKSAQFLEVRSDDDGVTWSKPTNLTRQLKKENWRLLAPSPSQGVSLDDGTLVVAVQGRISSDEPFSALMTSRDHGATWKLSEPATGAIASESQVAPLSDGTLMLNMRTEKIVDDVSEKFRSVMTTRDFGQTWQAHPTHRKGLIEPGCNASLLRATYQEGGQKKQVLLFANPYSQKGRTHQSIRVSFDDGQTWPEERRILLDEGRGAGYPSLAQLDPETIGIVYEGSQSHLVFQRIPLAELLGK